MKVELCLLHLDEECDLQKNNLIMYSLFEYKSARYINSPTEIVCLRCNQSYNVDKSRVIKDYFINNFNQLDETEKNIKFHNALESVMKDIISNLNEKYPNQVDTLSFNIDTYILNNSGIKLLEPLINLEDCNFSNKNSTLNINLTYLDDEYYKRTKPTINNLYYPVKLESQNITFTVTIKKEGNTEFYINISNIEPPNNYSSITLVKLEYDKEYFEISKQENTGFSIKSNCKELFFKECAFAKHLTLSSNDKVNIKISDTDVKFIKADLKNSNLDISNYKEKQDSNLVVMGFCKVLSVYGVNIELLFANIDEFYIKSKVQKINIQGSNIKDFQIGTNSILDSIDLKIKHINIYHLINYEDRVIPSYIENFTIYQVGYIGKLLISNESIIKKFNLEHSKINELRINHSEIDECKIIGLQHCENEFSCNKNKDTTIQQNTQKIFSFNKTKLKDLIIVSSHLEELEIYDSKITGYFVLSRNQIYKSCTFVMLGIGNIFNFIVNTLDKFFINKIYFIDKQNNIITGEKYNKNINDESIKNLKAIFLKTRNAYNDKSDYDWEKDNVLENWRDSTAFIKAKLDANKNHIEANKFYQLEMLIQGKILDSKLPSICNPKDKWYVKLGKVCDVWVDKTLHCFDRRFSNHSQSTLRAIGWYLAIVVLGSLLLCILCTCWSSNNFIAIAFPPYFPSGVSFRVGVIFLLFKPLSTYAIWQIIKSSRQNVRRS